jgi:hypothetical protein
LQSWQLQESDRDTWLLLDSAIDRLTRGIQNEPINERVLSVSEALSQVKRLIGENEYTIEGELSEVRAVKQMYYFGLKDNQDTRLDCSVFGGVILRGGFPLNEGLSVRVKGQFKLSKVFQDLF